MVVTSRGYWRLLKAGFAEQSTYRLAALGGLTANLTFGLLKVSILFATVRAAGGSVAGYDVGTMSAYVWISQSLLGAINLTGRTDIAERIRVGDVAVDLLRPLDLQAASVAMEFGKSLWSLLPRALPLMTVGILVVGMHLPDELAPYPLGLLSVLLGILLSCTTAYLVAVAGFWLVDARGLQYFYMVLSGFLAGLFVPIDLFPDWLRSLALATPFPSMMMFPIDVLSGRVLGWSSLGLVGVQLIWLSITVLAGRLLTRAGRHRLEVQGG